MNIMDAYTTRDIMGHYYCAPSYEEKHEVCCVGAGITTGFQNTEELHMMKYDQVMNGPDHEEWKKAVEEEH